MTTSEAHKLIKELKREIAWWSLVRDKTGAEALDRERAGEIVKGLQGNLSIACVDEKEALAKYFKTFFRFMVVLIALGIFTMGFTIGRMFP